MILSSNLSFSQLQQTACKENKSRLWLQTNDARKGQYYKYNTLYCIADQFGRCLYAVTLSYYLIMGMIVEE